MAIAAIRVGRHHTRYEAADKGQTLVQIVNHRVKGTAYPVVADPWVTWTWNSATVHLSRSDITFIAANGAWGLSALMAIPGAGWTAYVALLGVVSYAAWAYANHQCANAQLVLGSGSSVYWTRC